MKRDYKTQARAFSALFLATLVLQGIFLAAIHLPLPNLTRMDAEASLKWEDTADLETAPQEETSFDADNSALPGLSNTEDQQGLESPLALGSSSLDKDLSPAELQEPGVLEKTVQHSVKNGETLSTIWQQHGASTTEALEVAKVFKTAGVPLSSVKAGEVIHLTKLVGNSSDSQILRFEKQLSEGRTFIIKAEQQDYSFEIIEPEIKVENRTVVSVIDYTFASSARAEQIPYAVIDEFVDLFGGRFEFSRDLQRGDSFSVTYIERKTADGAELSPGAIQTASLMSKGELMVAVRHEGSDKEARYFDGQGNLIGNYFLRYPVQFSRISSVFSDSRFHPVLKRKRPHYGVDFAAPTGTPVRTVAPGIVEVAGYTNANGYWIKIRHSDRWSTAYLHLSRIEKGVKKGARVERGQQIGRVGSTGYSTGPHLHFSLYDRGKYVDPMKTKIPQIPEKGGKIPQELLLVKLQEIKNRHQELRVAKAETDQSETRQG